MIAAIALGLALGFTLQPFRGDGETGLRLWRLKLPEICGFRRATGHPCATCGITRSVVYALHGRFRDSFESHPFGLVVVALAVLEVVPRAAVAAGRGRRWVGRYDRAWLVASVGAVLSMFAWWVLGLGLTWLSSGPPP